jgi:hypothetical protein
MQGFTKALMFHTGKKKGENTNKNMMMMMMMMMRPIASTNFLDSVVLSSIPYLTHSF